MVFKKLILFLFIFCTGFVSAQKVGLVLSGGGAKGLAHIGTLKALEENHIPIDYITGTSMGGIVGAMYAAGYSPAQIEKIALSKDFQDWVSGKYTSDYNFFFQKTPLNATMLSAKVAIDTGFNFTFRSNLVNDIPLNFALLELFSQASAVSKNNFDSLFVPFRCMVSDVLSQNSIAVHQGSLSDAVRGTLTVPLIYRPIKLDDKYVFDGGLYNNFPVDVMKTDFKPDYIIGANVSAKIFNEYPKNNDDHLMNRFLLFMFLSKSDSTLIGKNGIYLQPNLSKFSASNFTPVAELIKKGYDAAIADMGKIKAAIKRRTNPDELWIRRSRFNNKKPDLVFSNVIVTGVTEGQKKYVERLFKSDKKTFNLDDISRGYYKLVADETFETVYPKISYNPKTDSYNFEIIAQPQKSFKLDLGGNISTRPISAIFIAASYNFLNQKAYSIAGSFYSGRFYESVQTSARIDYPTKLPLYLNAELTYNHWNFYNTSEIFNIDPNPKYIEQSDKKVDLSVGFPLNKNAKVSMNVAFINNFDRYSPNNTFSIGDVLDKTIFNGYRVAFSLEKYTLNRKQYASRGRNLKLAFNYFDGQENYMPGNIYRLEPFYNTLTSVKKDRYWGNIKLSDENYTFHSGKYTFGYLLEGVLSNQPLFSSYYGNLLIAPAFYPLQDSKSVFLDNFRAQSYIAGGLKNIFTIKRNLDFRLEGYIFLPYKAFEETNAQTVNFSKKFNSWHYAATTALVYRTPIGPVSLSYNLYDDKMQRNGVLLHLGYLIYNKRSIE